MRNLLLILAGLGEMVTTLVLLPVARFHRSPSIVARLDRLANGVDALRWMVRHG